MLLGPVALLALTLSEALKVVHTLITYWSGSSSLTSNTLWLLFNRGKWSLTDTKKSFIVLASKPQSPSVYLLARPCMRDLPFVLSPIVVFILLVYNSYTLVHYRTLSYTTNTLRVHYSYTRVRRCGDVQATTSDGRKNWLICYMLGQIKHCSRSWNMDVSEIICVVTMFSLWFIH